MENYEGTKTKVREEALRLLEQAKLEAKQEVEEIMSRSRNESENMVATAQGRLQRAIEAVVEEIVASL